TISLFAVMGLLAQAAALQRHSRAMLGAALVSQLGAISALICHGRGDPAPTQRRGPDDLDGVCPICTGLGAALIAHAAPPVFWSLAEGRTEVWRPAAAHAPRLGLLPPVRAPPSFAQQCPRPAAPPAADLTLLA